MTLETVVEYRFRVRLESLLKIGSEVTQRLAIMSLRLAATPSHSSQQGNARIVQRVLTRVALGIDVGKGEVRDLC